MKGEGAGPSRPKASDPPGKCHNRPRGGNPSRQQRRRGRQNQQDLQPLAIEIITREYINPQFRRIYSAYDLE